MSSSHNSAVLSQRPLTFASTIDYIVQGHRYNIIENVGCTPDIYNTVPAYPLVFIWPVVLGFVTFVYAGMILS